MIEWFRWIGADLNERFRWIVAELNERFRCPVCRPTLATAATNSTASDQAVCGNQNISNIRVGLRFRGFAVLSAMATGGQLRDILDLPTRR